MSAASGIPPAGARPSPGATGPCRLNVGCGRSPMAGIRTPHGGSDAAWEDPTHVRACFAGSFGFFSQPHCWRADYGYRVD